MFIAYCRLVAGFFLGYCLGLVMMDLIAHRHLLVRDDVYLLGSCMAVTAMLMLRKGSRWNSD